MLRRHRIAGTGTRVREPRNVGHERLAACSRAAQSVCGRECEREYALLRKARAAQSVPWQGKWLGYQVLRGNEGYCRVL